MNAPQGVRRRIRGTTAERISRAQAMRRHMTPAESRLWQALRNRQLGGLRFRAQHPVGPFILDFYCAQVKLAIEIDGPSHQRQEEDDAARTEHLAAYGYRVLRFTAEIVMTRLDEVLEAILDAARPPGPQSWGSERSLSDGDSQG